MVHGWPDHSPGPATRCRRLTIPADTGPSGNPLPDSPGLRLVRQLFDARSHEVGTSRPWARPAVPVGQ